MEKLLTLAIPTNGIIQWVFPVLESIYNQGIDSNRFEVVITDNGDNEEFYYKILEFKKQHDNLIYKKTNAYMFENQIEAFKIAHGTFIKFINHRTRLIPEALDYLLTYVEKNSKEKPVTFFLNGAGDIKVKNKY